MHAAVKTALHWSRRNQQALSCAAAIAAGKQLIGNRSGLVQALYEAPAFGAEAGWQGLCPAPPGFGALMPLRCGLSGDGQMKGGWRRYHYYLGWYVEFRSSSEVG